MSKKSFILFGFFPGKAFGSNITTYVQKICGAAHSEIGPNVPVPFSSILSSKLLFPSFSKPLKSKVSSKPSSQPLIASTGKISTTSQVTFPAST